METDLIRQNLAAGELQDALALLAKAADGSAHKNAAIALQGRFAAWKHESRTGQIDGSAERNRIQMAALELCDALEKPAPAAPALDAVASILLKGKRAAQTIFAEKVAFFAERLAIDANSASLFLQLREAQKNLDAISAEIAAIEKNQ